MSARSLRSYYFQSHCHNKVAKLLHIAELIFTSLSSSAVSVRQLIEVSKAVTTEPKY